MASLQQWIVEKPWLETKCALGEGPIFEQATNSVRFVDIINKRLHTASLDQGISSLKTIQLDVCPTVSADIDGIDPQEKILIGCKYGIAVLDREAGKYELVQRFNEPDNERIRSNDGAADVNGRFWIGTMTDFNLGPFQAEGSLYRFEANSPHEEFCKGLTIPNSVGWSPDNRTMYFTHSTAQQILAYDYDPSTGAATNRRVFFQMTTHGDPDGFRVDVDGNLWSAVYGESRVLKINPAGELVGEVLLPTKNATCVAFAGTELLITTAGDDEGEGLSKQYGGAVFRVDVGIKGLEVFKVKL